MPPSRVRVCAAMALGPHMRVCNCAWFQLVPHLDHTLARYTIGCFFLQGCGMHGRVLPLLQGMMHAVC